MIPKQNNCIPPIKIMTQIVEAHPATGSPKINCHTMTINNAIKEHNVIKIPNQEAMLIGACEKLIIPSIAYLNNFQKLHLVSPATLSTFS